MHVITWLRVSRDTVGKDVVGDEDSDGALVDGAVEGNGVVGTATGGPDGTWVHTAHGEIYYRRLALESVARTYLDRTLNVLKLANSNHVAIAGIDNFIFGRVKSKKREWKSWIGRQKDCSIWWTGVPNSQRTPRKRKEGTSSAHKPSTTDEKGSPRRP